MLTNVALYTLCSYKFDIMKWFYQILTLASNVKMQKIYIAGNSSLSFTQASIIYHAVLHDHILSCKIYLINMK